MMLLRAGVLSILLLSSCGAAEGNWFRSEGEHSLEAASEGKFWALVLCADAANLETIQLAEDETPELKSIFLELWMKFYEVSLGCYRERIIGSACAAGVCPPDEITEWIFDTSNVTAFESWVQCVRGSGFVPGYVSERMESCYEQMLEVGDSK